MLNEIEIRLRLVGAHDEEALAGFVRDVVVTDRWSPQVADAKYEEMRGEVWTDAVIYLAATGPLPEQSILRESMRFGS